MQLEDAIRFVSVIRRVDTEMPLQQIHCLLLIAKEEDGLSLSDLAKKAEIGVATASRYVAALGKINRHKEEGFNLIEAFEDPMERRRKIIRLTPKGRAIVRRLLGEDHANL